MKESLPGETDVVIIGAGIVGLGIAFALRQRGRQVLVLERDHVGAGATWAAAGMLAPVSEAQAEEPALVDLALESHGGYEEFVGAIEEASGMGCGLRREGTVIVALGRDHDEELDHLLEAQRRRGLTSRRLTADQVFELEPHLSGWVTSGLLAAEDRQVDSRLLVRALARAFTKSGGALVEGVSVEAVETEGGRLRRVNGKLNGRQLSVGCDVAVVAAGAWSSTSLESPASGYGIRPVKGQTIRLRGPRLLSHVLRTPDVYVLGREGGELVVGATMEEQGFDETPTAGPVMDLLRRAWHGLPGIYDCEFAEVSVGLRPAASDHLPVMGETEVAGVFAATGHYRHGILLAPATARMMADLIVDGRESTLMAPFRPDRLRGTGD